MGRPDLFTDRAAQRHADAVNSGERSVREVAGWVRDWFAAVYGWPLAPAQAEECREFWRSVDSRIEVGVR